MPARRTSARSPAPEPGPVPARAPRSGQRQALPWSSEPGKSAVGSSSALQDLDTNDDTSGIIEIPRFARHTALASPTSTEAYESFENSSHQNGGKGRHFNG